jgi:hypothetical protein
MLIIILILFLWVGLLYFEIMEMSREYLCDISLLKLRFKEKEKEIFELKKQIEYYKNKLRYEDYLKD